MSLLARFNRRDCITLSYCILKNNFTKARFVHPLVLGGRVLDKLAAFWSNKGMVYYKM